MLLVAQLMRVTIATAVFMLTGCPGAAPETPAGGDDTLEPDAATATPDTPANACPIAATTADTGALTALKSQRCNVPGTMGAQKWFRLSAALPAQATDIVQIELWDGRGAFTGATVAAGTYPLTGAELSPTTCGICVRAVGDKGAAGAKQYFATGGTVTVTSVGAAGATLSASVSNITFAEVDAAGAAVTGGCSANVSGAALSGTVQDVGGGGGGGGGQCPTTVGD